MCPHRVSIDPERLVVTGGGLRGSLGHSVSATFGNVIRLMASDRLDMSRIVTNPVGLDGAVEGLERLRDREAGKYMVLSSRAGEERLDDDACLTFLLLRRHYLKRGTKHPL